MIKQIKSSDIKKFIQDNPNTVLLDVRTEDEWNTVGKPETKDLGIKSYFITISQDPSFLENIKKEVLEAKRTFQKYKWPLIDVTRKSVEETAASIIKIHEIYSNNVR